MGHQAKGLAVGIFHRGVLLCFLQEGGQALVKIRDGITPFDGLLKGADGAGQIPLGGAKHLDFVPINRLLCRAVVQIYRFGKALGANFIGKVNRSLWNGLVEADGPLGCLHQNRGGINKGVGAVELVARPGQEDQLGLGVHGREAFGLLRWHAGVLRTMD